MSPTTRSPTSSSTPRVPSPTLLRHRTWTWTTLRSASCSLKYTENTPITAVRKVCLSVSRHCLSRPVERGNLGENNLDQFSFGVRNTYSAHNQFPAITQAEKWSIERGNPWEKTVPVHRLGPCLMNRDR